MDSAHLKHLPEDALKEILALTQAKTKLEVRESASTKFMPFAHHVYDNFIEGRHHRIIAEKLERVAAGELKRLIICMPPRHSKSELSSFLMPVWFLGRNPKLKIIQATHNTDLAVRFGRKVRDLIDDPHYNEIFPDTKLKEDNKSAGNWQTSAAGEYYACITPDTLVLTPRGQIAASDVKPGDVLLNASGPVSVEHVYHSTHDATVQIGELKCSKNHPIWTTNRGWVDAGDLTENDLLCVESILDKMKVLIERIKNGIVEYTNVPSLVQHEISLRKPKKREVSPVRGAWNFCLRPLAGLSIFFGRHGAPSFAHAHDRSKKQRWVVQPGKLSLGNPMRAEQQQAHECDYEWQDVGGKRSRFTDHSGGDSISIGQWSRSFESEKAAQSALQKESPPDDIGRLRRFALQFLARGRGGDEPGKTGSWLKSHLEGVYWGAQKLQGFLLGVRRAGPVSQEEHGPRPFVNYLVSGDNTFFADGILTHNCGVGSAMTGRGADLLVIDDPHSEQDALSDTAFDHAYEWYTSGPRQRLQPGGAIIVVMTRWGKKDLVGRLLAQQASDPMADQWEVVEFPAILPSGDVLWPEFWTKEAMLSIKASLPVSKWSAQWQQQPTSAESAIVKREWWRMWEKDDIPPLNYIMQAYDTAFSKKETADYSAITTWGIFDDEETGKEAIMLLDARRGRWNFPELREIAFTEHDYWEPDMVIVEKKASGGPLIDELRKRGIPAVGFSPGRKAGGGGVDKTTRMHLVSPLFESGVVWAPENKRFAEEVIEEVASFPVGDHDDYVDSMTLALMRFRQGGLIAIAADEQDDEELDFIPRKREYY